MKFADKLIQLRKKAGWSQEELAEQMDVTRQSISKWEGAQSIPDIEKIIRLSMLFGVSTDYLLKDEMEDPDCSVISGNLPALRHVTMEEARAFLLIKSKTSKLIALATFLCILSPICLLILGAISESLEYNLKENVAGGIGMIVLLILVAIAVALFIFSGRRTAVFNFLRKEIFETEKDVFDMVSKQKANYNKTYTRNNIIGVCLCIMAIIPLFIGLMLSEKNDILLMIMLSICLVLVGIGVVFLIISGIIWASYDQLLQDGDFSKDKKKNQSIMSAISVVYWLIITAIYLGYSLPTNNWEYSWIIWVVAGVIFPAICIITKFFSKRKKMKAE